MAVYRKKLVDKDGNTIIPAIGDIYGPVYTARLSSSSGGIATYTFTPDTPVENSRVYAVKFPAPTTNNTIILGDGTTFGSVLVPPVAATDTPNYELLDTTMINDTEPLLLMYNGIQWVCLNQKRSVSSGDIDWTTFKHPAPTATILETIGTITSTRSYTAPSNGFLIGKGVSWANGGKAGVFLTNSDNYMVGGIPYTEYAGNNQVAFCVPVYKGQTVYFRVSGGSSRLEEVRLVASHSEAGM